MSVVKLIVSVVQLGRSALGECLNMTFKRASEKKNRSIYDRAYT